MVAMRARQRDRFGGIRWGSAFFGLLSAIGLAAILLGIAAAAGVALGVSEINDVRTGSADTIGLGGAILVLATLALSWYCGGYVAGRMARFDGARQGIGVWVWTLVIGAALAIAAVIGGSEYDVLQQLNLPNVAVGDESLTTRGSSPWPPRWWSRWCSRSSAARPATSFTAASTASPRATTSRPRRARVTA